METLTPNEEQPEQQSDFLDDIIDTREYDKKIKSAQNTIFIVAGVQLIFGLIVAFTGPEEVQNIQIGVAVVISAIFFGLGLWCKKKPFTAIIIALTVYSLLLISDAIYDPATIVKGAIVKAFIIIYLAKGIGAAKTAQEIRNIGK